MAMDEKVSLVEDDKMEIVMDGRRKTKILTGHP